MKTRIMVGAFLTHGNEMLLLHRNADKKIAPGMWSCVGGHMEPDELNDPLKTCYREVEEESGITKEQIRDLKLKYIYIRSTGEEIQTIYYFFGSLPENYTPAPCAEGTLHWVDFDEIPKKEMSFSVKHITKHRLSNQNDENIYLCAKNGENDGITLIKL